MSIGHTVVLANTLTAALFYGGTGYAVFVLGHSGWWFALAAVVHLLCLHEVKKPGGAGGDQ